MSASHNDLKASVDALVPLARDAFDAVNECGLPLNLHIALVAQVVANPACHDAPYGGLGLEQMSELLLASGRAAFAVGFGETIEAALNAALARLADRALATAKGAVIDTTTRDAPNSATLRAMDEAIAATSLASLTPWLTFVGLPQLEGGEARVAILLTDVDK